MPQQNQKQAKVDHSLIDAFDQFVEQFKAESDRAAVILGTSKLDFLLFQLLNHFLVPNYSKNDDLFDGDAPLSTLSSRINLSYRLGIIDARFAKALHLVRKIRNDFAHEVSDARLETAPHRDRIKELTALLANTAMFTDVQAMYFSDKAGPAADFFTALALLAARLETLIFKVAPLSGGSAYPIEPPKYSQKTDRKSRRQSKASGSSKDTSSQSSKNRKGRSS